MPDGALALAAGAGLLAAINPCGFALLPAYLSFLVLGDGAEAHPSAVWRAIRTTAVMALGFVGVFAVFGLLVAPVAASAQRYLPWFTVALGVLLLGLGGWLLAGGRPPAPGLRPPGVAVTGSLRSVFGFGVSYGMASLTCTIAPFLAVVVAAFREESVWAGMALFVAYAAGMALVVGTAAVAVALARASLIVRMRRLGRIVPRAGGAVLVLAGGYVAYYGWWEIRVLRGATPNDPVVEAASAVQEWLAGTVNAAGMVGVALALGALIAASGVIARVRTGRWVSPRRARRAPGARW